MTYLGNTIKTRLSDLGKTQTWLAETTEVSNNAVSKWIKTGKISRENALVVAGALGIGVDRLLTEQAPPVAPPARSAPVDHPRKRLADFELVQADATTFEVGEIEYWEARGSCGGGFMNSDQIPKGKLIKEASFFAKFGVQPSSLFAIYADGDSMSDYIVDGDLVIFNRARTEPRSGKIFAIEHPDGTRIKILRRGIDGAWILESRNVDKRAFPDERIAADQMDLLKILGEFVYRQGG